MGDEEQQWHWAQVSLCAGSKVDVFSKSRGEWQRGRVTQNGREWLIVEREGGSKRKMKRFSDSLRHRQPPNKREDAGPMSKEKQRWHWDRMAIGVGCKVEVFSQAKREWRKGRVSETVHDEQGEW